MLENYNTFAETEALLQTTIKLPGNSIKEIAAATGIKPNTLYNRILFAGVKRDQQYSTPCCYYG